MFLHLLELGEWRAAAERLYQGYDILSSLPCQLYIPVLHFRGKYLSFLGVYLPSEVLNRVPINYYFSFNNFLQTKSLKELITRLKH